jgi:ATP-dependent DNA helicase RecG
MSATPIPRTLALTLYGDLDISRITEMPKGRQRVDTFAVNEAYRARINDFIRKQVELGGQCYIVCPSIESKEDLDASSVYYEPTSISSPFSQKSNDLELKDVYSYTEKLRTNLPDIEIEFLHGKMKADEKEEIMKRFASGDVKVLVSTTVIEVGINVPNASLMIVENADRFGLSQLHQLRGRVGRGNEQSYCILFSQGASDVTKKRMEIMCKSNDGFFISEEDLKLRGPGDFFGSRQSGLPVFRVANLSCDLATLKAAQQASAQWIDTQGTADTPEANALRARIAQLFARAEGTMN